VSLCTRPPVNGKIKKNKSYHSPPKLDKTINNIT